MRVIGNWYTFGFLFLPGVGLLLLCSYYLVSGVYHQVAWHSTTGTITGFVIKDTGEDEVGLFEKAVFVEHTGGKIEVIAHSGVSEEKDLRTGKVTILYNPTNPSEAIIFSFRDYLIMIFIPFAALLIYLGWPFTDTSNANLKSMSRPKIG